MAYSIFKYASESAGDTGPSGSPSASPVPTGNRNANSVNNTLSKSMQNTDIQSISRSDNKVPNIIQPSQNMAVNRSQDTSRMSHMEDRRILNQPRSNAGAGSMSI